MTIANLSSFILHVPVTGSQISDSTHSVTHWGVVGARVELADGTLGFGYTGTHAHLPSDRLIAQAVDECYAPLLAGAEFEHPRAHYRRLFHYPPLQWVGRAGILQLALCAVDVALWDAYAKTLAKPLWAVIGGPAREAVQAYNTDVGWLSFSQKELVANVKRAVDEGFEAVKMKVGSPRLETDLRRCEAVRDAVGRRITVATDANGTWDLPTAQRFARQTRDLGLLWIEEPLWYDDIESHRALATTTALPVALGEQIYTPESMAQFIRRGAVEFVQPDVTRIGGVTGFLDAAMHAGAEGLPVAAHAGDMSQVHVHMAYALPNHTMLEYIPWIAHCFDEPARVEDGVFIRPEQPGASTTPTFEAWEKYRAR
jgi:L-alanine-DL-glutamate epimerase-like enolase superfamily enzyme